MLYVLIAVDCTVSNEIEDIQFQTTKHAPDNFNNFNTGICSFFPRLREQADPARVGRGNKGVPYLPVTLLAARAVCQ